jgi:oligopeptide/dipeptide ABC transporter ATP-binding protein
MTLLSVENLCVEFATPQGPMRAVDGASFTVAPGEMVGIVGESGSGKTVTCRSVLRLLPSRNARIAGGRILFEGRDLATLGDAAMRDVRGPQIAMIFQNPSTHLDPVMTVGDQVAEAIVYHQGASRSEARRRAAELLRQVGIPDAERQLDAYAHQFSGGMRQRVMIAAALSCRPKLLIADEPTTALDVTVQAQILRLLLDLRDRTGLAIILVTHDLGVVAQTCDSVAVMYAGRIVERASKRDLLRRPLHPYTEGLVRSQPEAARPGEPLPSIDGQPPSLAALPQGCRFHPRCAYVEPACRVADVPLVAAGASRASACRRWEVLAARQEGGA